MEFLYEWCLNYAQKFGRFYVRNMLMLGDPGLGKTFLSACIARTVAENGFSVVYDTAVNLFSKFEEQKFSKDVQEGRAAQSETRRYLNCDLLILDDLGSEMTTPFVQSALYTVVNTRLTQEKATVISSNLSMDGIRARYAGQTASRLEGEYRVLRFFGEDIRLQRKAKL
jgi:DNA replication protein DnaC